MLFIQSTDETSKNHFNIMKYKKIWLPEIPLLEMTYYLIWNIYSNFPHS